MKRTTLCSIVAAMLIVALAPACGGGPAGGDPLDGTSWVLAAYRKTAPIPGTEITAAFRGGQVTGNAGCNSYFGSYEAQGGEISVGAVGSTEMACMDPEGVMEQELEYLKHLSDAQTYQIEGDRLTIYWDNHEALTFAPK